MESNKLTEVFGEIAIVVFAAYILNFCFSKYIDVLFELAMIIGEKL